MVAPWLLGFHKKWAACTVPVLLGAGAIVYSLFTDYELGIEGEISMPAHLKMDLASGVFLTVSPWLLGFARKVFAPHLAFGLFEIAAALLTKKHPRYGPRHWLHQVAPAL